VPSEELAAAWRGCAWFTWGDGTMSDGAVRALAPANSLGWSPGGEWDEPAGGRVFVSGDPGDGLYGCASETDSWRLLITDTKAGQIFSAAGSWGPFPHFFADHDLKRQQARPSVLRLDGVSGSTLAAVWGV